MLIGIDFDNTIVCYDQAFHQAALKQGLIPPEVPAVKNRVRDYLRSQGGEEDWIKLQGLVYGGQISEGLPFPGVLEFLEKCKLQGACVAIISHRTRHAARGYPYDLHEAAHSWLESNGFKDPSGPGESVETIHFELTWREKLDRVGRSGCSYFIDDLPEFLGDPFFPSQVQPILFDPAAHFKPENPVKHATSWTRVGEFIFGENHS